MRGSDERSGELFSYVDLEDRVPAQHPLRLIRRIVNDVLVAQGDSGVRKSATAPIVATVTYEGPVIGVNTSRSSHLAVPSPVLADTRRPGRAQNMELSMTSSSAIMRHRLNSIDPL
jgi:hypothetical protein